MLTFAIITILISFFINGHLFYSVVYGWLSYAISDYFLDEGWSIGIGIVVTIMFWGGASHDQN
ncbi:hypothetical protein A4G19_01855 [Pasteurellaceae bacterium Macca]|nr:hypothetical protein [Pasteurellaceae bacterium Macca]